MRECRLPVALLINFIAKLTSCNAIFYVRQARVQKRDLQHHRGSRIPIKLATLDCIRRWCESQTQSTRARSR